MKTYSYLVSNQEELKTCLFSEQLLEELSESKSILVKILMINNDSKLYYALRNEVKKYVPKAIVIGITTAGTICEGNPENIKCTVVINTYIKTDIVILHHDGTKDIECFDAGSQMREQFNKLENPIFLFFNVTTKIFDVNEFAKGFLDEGLVDVQVAGAGAGGEFAEVDALRAVAYENEFFGRGILGIALLGKDTYVYTECVNGNMTLTADFIATKVDDNTILEFDGKPAFSVYREYLGLEPDENFSERALTFPLITVRDGEKIARAPLDVTKNEALVFIADVCEGEAFKIGFVNNDIHNQKMKKVIKEMKEFEPEAIMLFPCCCRKELMRDGICQETLLFECIADTSGYFTHGEIYKRNNNIVLKNTETVIIGIREGKKRGLGEAEGSNTKETSAKRNEAKSKNSLTVNALLQCIEAVKEKNE